MSAIELFHQDGKPAGVWYCGTCRLARPTQQEADSCCQPRLCEDCGKTTDRRYMTVCDACNKVLEKKREAELFAKAEKVTEWDGWLYLEGAGHNHGYFTDLEEFEEWLADEEVEQRPLYAWTCTARQFVHVDASDITERLADNAYEDWDPDTLNGLPELKAALAAFVEANKDAVSYEPSFKLAFILPPAPEDSK